jgi:hypothetical protein
LGAGFGVLFIVVYLAVGYPYLSMMFG